MHKHATDYTKPLLAGFERNLAAFDSVKIPDFLANFERNLAAFDSVKIPDFLAEFERNFAAFDSLNIPNVLAGFERNLAAFDDVRIPNILADFERNFAAFDSPNIPNLVANFDFNAAALESLKAPNFLEEFERNAADCEETKEYADYYVETYYNRDLAYQSTEEPNHAIENYNEVIISNLESILGDGLAFSAGNKEASINITINVRQLTIGQMIQGGEIEMKSEVSNSQVGILNTGEMQAKSITGSVSPSADPSQQQIAEALTSLTVAVKASQNISSQRQTEIKEQLELLNEQVKLAPSERKVGLIKPILSALATALSAGGGAAEIWSQWGDTIKNFFGIHE